MRKFIKKILLFSIPLIIIFSPVIVVLYGSGENFTSIDKILKSGKKYLIGYAYNENNYGYLKWKTIESTSKKEILALGSSRVLAFREDMFNTSFYNAGYTINNMEDYLLFFENIPKNKYPRLLIIGLDQWMFNPNYGDLKQTKNNTFWEKSFTFKPSPSTIKTSYINFLDGKYDFSAIYKKNDFQKIGLNALMNNKGMRRDGSMFYGSQIEMLLDNDPLANDFNYSNTLLRIREGNRKFEYANHSNLNAYVKLDEFLNFCKKNNIYVIGFFPPYANVVYQKMLKTNKYKYLQEIYPKSYESFSKYNFELFDFTDISKFGSTDAETIDGFHGGELMYLKMLLHMSENKSDIKHFINIKKIQIDINKRSNNYIVYDY
jgi:hypothetical protein